MSGTKIYGCLAAQNEDSVGETIDIKGLELQPRVIVDEHRGENPSFFHTLGPITYHKKLFSEQDCENDLQLRSWRRVGVPMVYIEGELIDSHPNAQSAIELLKFMSTVKNPPFTPGLSVDGGIIERKTRDGRPTEDKEEGKILSRTLALAGALTIKPCNPKCFVALQNDLQKSAWVGPPPAAYSEALKKSQATSSFFESDSLKLWMKMGELKKSLNDLFTGFASTQCKQCGTPTRFFKSSSDIPNRCTKCGEAYSIGDLWKALKS